MQRQPCIASLSPLSNSACKSFVSGPLKAAFYARFACSKLAHGQQGPAVASSLLQGQGWALQMSGLQMRLEPLLGLLSGFRGQAGGSNPGL